jgi:hypothetical protein
MPPNRYRPSLDLNLKGSGTWNLTQALVREEVEPVTTIPTVAAEDMVKAAGVVKRYDPGKLQVEATSVACHWCRSPLWQQLW